MIEYIKIIDIIKENYPDLDVMISYDRLYVGKKSFKISGVLCSKLDISSKDAINNLLNEIKIQYLDKKRYDM